MNYIRILGIVLLVIGVTVSLLGFLIVYSIYLTALGLGFIMLGLVFLGVSLEFVENIRPYNILVNQSMINLRLILESLGVEEFKPVYLPSSMCDGLGLALIPTGNNVKGVRKIPRSFIVRYGTKAEDVGVLIATAGTPILQEETIEEISDVPGLEAILSRILVNKLKSASSIKAVESDGIFRIHISSPILWNLRVKPFGSFYAQIVGQVFAEALRKPVYAVEVKNSRREVIIEVKRIE